MLKSQVGYSINPDSYYAIEFIYNEMLYTALNIDKISSDKRIIVTDM